LKGLPAPKLAGLVLALALAAGCGRRVLPVCPGEDQATLRSGILPSLQARAVADPRSGGALSGRPSGHDRPKKLILLLDYSGSMYPGYGKPQVPSCQRCAAGLSNGRSLRNGQPYYLETPEFREFLGVWLDAATPSKGDLGLEVLLFNGRVFRLGTAAVEPFAPGEELRFERRLSRAGTPEIASWLSSIRGNPFEVDAQTAGITDSRAALRSALAAIGRDEAILWLITDNIVDTEGGALADPDARLTTEFYRELSAEPRIQMVASYPIFLGKPCSWMCSTSLFAYGMYVSSFERPDSAEFHRLGGTTPDGGGPREDGLLWNPELRKLAAVYSGAQEKPDLAGVPVRLKPIDTEALAIRFKSPALRCARAEFGQELRCQARVEVRNILRHQTVDSAKLTLSNETLLPRKERGHHRLAWASAVCAGGLETLAWKIQGGRQGRGDEPIEIGPLAPLQAAVVDVRFKLPAVQVDTGSRSTLADVALTNRILLHGLLRAEIRDFRTSLAIDPRRFATIYGSGQLPAIFRKGEVGSASASYAIDAQLANDGQALALLALLGVGGVGALCALAVMRFQRKQVTVLVDGVETARLSLPRWSRRDLEIGGVVRAVLRRGWGSDYRILPKSGVRLRRDGAAWILRIGEEVGDEHRLEIRRGWSPAKSSTAFGSRMENW
jgi:hypothetical protein